MTRDTTRKLLYIHITTTLADMSILVCTATGSNEYFAPHSEPLLTLLTSSVAINEKVHPRPWKGIKFGLLTQTESLSVSN